MKELVIPIIIKNFKIDTKLPVLLYQSKDKYIVIKLCAFTKNEKEVFFDVKYTQNSPNQISLQYNPRNFRMNRIDNEMDTKYLMESNFKITIMIKCKADGIRETKIYEKVDFVFKIVLGCSFDVVQIKTEPFGGFKKLAVRFLSRRSLIFNKDVLGRIRKLIKILFEEKETKEIENLNFFLDAAMRFQPLNTAGAFFVTILENIFVRENTELSYRLSMRLAKKRKKGLDFVDKIKKLYNKRSKIFHGKNHDFTLEDVELLETEACYAIEEFLINPESFEIANLDKNLLS